MQSIYHPITTHGKFVDTLRRNAAMFWSKRETHKKNKMPASKKEAF